MEIHYTKHHQAYIDKLNAAVKGSTMNLNVSDEEKCASVDNSTNPAIRNNLGGYYNHSLFWTLMKPNPKAAPNVPTGKLAQAINQKFNSFETFKKDFSDHAAKIFGSGWCWLILKNGAELKIVTSPNQDNPLMQVGIDMGTPVLGLDVWEHAYYLKYQNKRADYIAGWWNVVNWDKAEELFTKK
jgi:Fe-Mn family superoxide dismutase